MALNASTNWYVRAGGNALNGGGWDPEIAGAGINYADADAAILSPTDLATSGAVATVTSASGGFTANMVGNCLRIASGTNFTPGYYFVVTFTDANTVVLDRACATAAGSGGTGRIGGAFATPWGNLANGGTTPAPTITTPLAPGHTVWIRGAGDDPPSSASFTMPAGYTTYPNGSLAVGPVRFVGYNGRPRIDVHDLFSYNGSYQCFRQLFFRCTASGTYPELGTLYLSAGSHVENCTFEQQGYDRVGVFVSDGNAVVGSRFQNSGSSAAGTHAALRTTSVYISYGLRVIGCAILGWRGAGIDFANASGEYGALLIKDTVVANCRSATLPLVRVGAYSAAGNAAVVIANCSIYGGLSDGLSVFSALWAVDDTYVPHMMQNLVIYNCVFASNTGYGLRLRGSAASNERLRKLIDHNAFYGNGSGRLANLNDGAHDITLSADPFTDAPGGDFTLNSAAGGGALIRDVAFPADFPSA